MIIVIDDSAIPALSADAPAGTKDLTLYAKAKVLELVAIHGENFRVAEAVVVAEKDERVKTATDPNAVAAAAIYDQVKPDKPKGASPAEPAVAEIP